MYSTGLRRLDRYAIGRREKIGRIVTADNASEKDFFRFFASSRLGAFVLPQLLLIFDSDGELYKTRSSNPGIVQQRFETERISYQVRFDLALLHSLDLLHSSLTSQPLLHPSVYASWIRPASIRTTTLFFATVDTPIFLL